MYYLLPAVPVGMLAIAVLATFDREMRPKFLPIVSEAWAALSIALSLVACSLSATFGPTSIGLAAAGGIGTTMKIDAISATVLLLVSFVGWVVLRYSSTYLDGEVRQAYFIKWLCATLACVSSLVIAGDLILIVLAWVGTSLSFHKLLLYYPDRPAAVRAARKKFITARIGDFALVFASVLMVFRYGTADLATILAAARQGAPDLLLVAIAGLIALAAVLKSAQFPTHGWLTEVMETPTPVSALLHAGIINAGGFLLIRFADVMVQAPSVLAILVIIGGFTALFGGITMLTQPSVKTSLAWSTISQMGFMVFECGLGLFSLALLHIVAHSLYKAHSFLAAGGAVERVAAIRRPGPIAVPGARAVATAFVAAFAIYAAAAASFSMFHHSTQGLALGAILILGVAYLLAQGFADTAPRALAIRTAGYAIATSVSYFALQAITVHLTHGALPSVPTPGPLEWVLLVLAIASFGAVALLQSTFPLWAYHPAAAGLRVHLANGCYVNAAIDRVLGSWRLEPTKQTSRTGGDR